MKLDKNNEFLEANESKSFLQFSLLILISKIRTYEKQELKKNNINITPKELAHLALISQMGEEKQQNLLNFFGVSKGTMSNMIKLLIKKNLVIQEKSAGDKRTKNLKLTSQGIKIAEINDKIRKDIKDYLRSNLSEDEFQQFMKLVLKLV